MLKNCKTYSIFDLIENKEVLTRVSSQEASEFLGVRSGVVHAFSQNGLNFKRRFRITRNERINDVAEEWIIDFMKEWEVICDYLNPNRKKH